MQIEAGKYYRTRDGRKVGPFTLRRWTDGFPWDEDTEDEYFWSDGGECQVRGNGENDLIAEWQDEGPVRTVTRRVIVPGLYGIVAVYRVQDQVRVTLTREDGTPDQLEAAARTLQQLAEALREG